MRSSYETTLSKTYNVNLSYINFLFACLFVYTQFNFTVKSPHDHNTKETIHAFFQFICYYYNKTTETGCFIKRLISDFWECDDCLELCYITWDGFMVEIYVEWVWQDRMPQQVSGLIPSALTSSCFLKRYFFSISPHWRSSSQHKNPWKTRSLIIQIIAMRILVLKKV